MINLKPEDVLNRIWEVLKEIEKKMPPKTTMEIKGYVVPRRCYDALMRNKDFRMWTEKGKANLGGYLVELNEDAEDIVVNYKLHQPYVRRKYQDAKYSFFMKKPLKNERECV